MQQVLDALWNALADAMPLLVGAVIALVVGYINHLQSKLRNASPTAAADVEREKRTHYYTPAEAQKAAVRKVRNTMGVVGSLIPSAMIKPHVEHVLVAAKEMETAKSDRPPAIEDANTQPIRPVKS